MNHLYKEDKLNFPQILPSGFSNSQGKDNVDICNMKSDFHLSHKKSRHISWDFPILQGKDLSHSQFFH